MSKINKTKLEAASQDLELRIREGQWLENLRTNGKSPEDVENKAKEILGVEENGSIIATAAEVLPKLNIARAALIQLNNLTDTLSSNNLLGEAETELFRSVERRLGEKVGKFFGVEELYEEE